MLQGESKWCIGIESMIRVVTSPVRGLVHVSSNFLPFLASSHDCTWSKYQSRDTGYELHNLMHNEISRVCTKPPESIQVAAALRAFLRAFFAAFPFAFEDVAASDIGVLVPVSASLVGVVLELFAGGSSTEGSSP